MYSVSIPVFMQHLNGLSGVLDKAAAWAAARKVNEADLLNMRLSPDMFNLARQIRAATDHAVNCAGMLSGKEAPKLGTEGKEIKITFPSGQVREFTGQSLLLGNALPNFYFHTTTAYAILRHNGIEIGKPDFIHQLITA
jgi:hypothetical protein